MFMRSKKMDLSHFKYKLEQRRVEREKIDEKNNDSNNTNQKLTSLSFNQELKIEAYLVSYLKNPLIDLPLSSEDILFELGMKFKDMIITDEFLQKLLIKFALNYKLIK